MFKNAKMTVCIVFLISLFFLAKQSFASVETSQSDVLQKIDPELLNVEGETSVIIEFSKKPDDYKQFIRSIGGSIGNDYKVIEGTEVKINGKNIQRLLEMKNVLKVHKNKQVKALLHDSAPLISADMVWEQGFTGKDVRVCVVDTGVDYTHSSLGYCSPLFVNGSIDAYTLQSSHPYPVYCDGKKDGCSWTITKLGYSQISVHFMNISLDNGWDFLYIEDANGNVLQNITGDYKDFWSVSVLGDTVKIGLVSDWYLCKYGFYADKVLNGSISFSFDNCSKVVAGHDFVNGDNDPMDDNGHGTHVTGIISSDDSYSRGIANGTKILAAKVLDSSGNGEESDVIAGIDWCLNNSAQIISMSLGGEEYNGTCDSDLLAKAVNDAVDKGVIAVVSAGNSGLYGLTTPACASRALAVGAIDKNKSVVGFSSKGPELDILAPGYKINSTASGGWRVMSGTSMAAPMVSGVVALLLEASPGLNFDSIKNIFSQSSDLVEKCYECTWSGSNCIDYYGSEIPCTSNVTGYGIVNAARALSLLSSDISAPKYYDLKEPSNPSFYSPDKVYNFSAKWIDDKSVDRVIIEFNGTNYTNLIQDRNVYIKSFEGLIPGLYQYKWYANDTSDKWNSTDYFNFAIENDLTPPTISIISPQNKTYAINSIPITFKINESTSWIGYSLDERSNVTINQNITLNLSAGSHSIVIYATDMHDNTGGSDKLYFTIDSTPPHVTIVSPTSSNYSTFNVSLIFSIDKPVSWIGYSINKIANVTITGPVNLTGLPNGWNNVTVFTNDTVGNIGFSTVKFFYCLADVNNDGTANMRDINLIIQNFNKQVSSCPRCDINSDGKIDMRDVSIAIINFNKPC